MYIILRFLVLFFAMHGFFRAAFAQDNPKPHYLGSRFDVLVEYQDSFSTLGEVLDELDSYGVISHTERMNLVGFLQDQGAGTEYKVLKPVMQDRNLNFGTNVLIYHSNGNIRAGSKALTFKKSNSFQKIFTETFNAMFDHEKLKGRPSEENAPALVEVASGALTTAVFASFYRPMNLVCEEHNVSVNKYMLDRKSLKSTNVVACKGKSFVTRWFDDIGNAPTLRKSAPCKGETCIFETSEIEQIVATGKLECENLARLPDLSREQAIPAKDVRAAMKLGEADSIPECSADTARRVEVYIKVQLAKVDRQIKTILQNHAAARPHAAVKATASAND